MNSQSQEMDAIMDMGLITNFPGTYSNNTLELVKNAFLYYDKGVFYIRHYSTVIFAYDSKSKICEINYGCSLTSNRQVNYALDYFGILFAAAIDVHKGRKMNYSGPLY